VNTQPIRCAVRAVGLLFVGFVFAIPPALAEPVFPGANWEYETNGLSPETLHQVDTYIHTLDTTGLMVVKHGRVVYEFGNVTNLSYVASVSKSILSMLYGPYVASGKIRLDATLKDLGMSDTGGLLPIEERAKVIDLITARSGVYHPIEDADDPNTPKRGSKEPGTYWFYNLWDFDAADAAFERMTGKDVYDALQDDLATPIGLQDFKRERQYKVVVPRSQYPVKHMVLSTRDMARLGLLMLRNGHWRDRQVIPADWVRRSTSVRTSASEMHAPNLAYGYMWWVCEDTNGPFHGGFMAVGSFGQFITVLPELDMVVAHKTVPPGNVDVPKYGRLLGLLTGNKPASADEMTRWARPPQESPDPPK